MLSEHRIVYLDNKATIFYKNIGHITVTPIHSNKSLLIVDGEFFLSLSSENSGSFVPKNHPDHWKKFQINCIIPYRWIFQTQRGHREDWITNKLETHLAPLPWLYQSITFGTVTWIRPIINIIFGAGIGVGIGSRDRDIVTLVPCQYIVTFSTVPKHRVTNDSGHRFVKQ